MLITEQFYDVIVDPGVLGEFGSQVRRERKVGILDGDLCRSLLGYQAGYLRSMVNIEQGGAERRNGTEWRDVYYKDFTLRVKRYSCKLWGLWVRWALSPSREKLGNASELSDTTCSTKVSLSESSAAAATLSYPLAHRARVNIERGKAGQCNETY